MVLHVCWIANRNVQNGEGLSSPHVCQAKTEILLNTRSPHSYLFCIKRS